MPSSRIRVPRWPERAATLDLIRAANTRLRNAARQASAGAEGVSQATGTIAAASRDIDEAMLQATTRVQQATQQVAQAHGLLGQLSQASEAIIGVVETISAVAKQTNLLALNATHRGRPSRRGPARVSRLSPVR